MLNAVLLIVKHNARVHLVILVIHPLNANRKQMSAPEIHVA